MSDFIKDHMDYIFIAVFTLLSGIGIGAGITDLINGWRKGDKDVESMDKRRR